MKIYNNIYAAILILIFSLSVFLCTLYDYGLSKVSNNNTKKEIVIEPGSIDSIATTLYQNNMIRSKLAFNIYARLNGKTKLMAATYKLSENMGTKKIIDILNKGNSLDKSNSITFAEGINMRKIAKIINHNTNNTEDDVYELLEDENYLDSLIEKYWFLTDDIKNTNIYYPLEGYLYPNTYAIDPKKTTVKEIFSKMLDETDKQLSKYKDEITNNSLSIHQLMTLSSIVELEGTNEKNRSAIARVFYNRLNSGMNLGSDVTTYYGAKVDMGQRDLYTGEVTECNNYNTRCTKFKTLPISPICNFSINTLKVVLSPEENDYYYFVADKNKKVYFSKTQSEHNDIIKKLKEEGLWYEY